MSKHAVLKMIPTDNSLNTAWAGALRVATDFIAAVNEDDPHAPLHVTRGWKLILLCFTGLLRRPEKGKGVREALRQRLRWFYLGEWGNLTALVTSHPSPTPPPQVRDTDEQRAKSVRRATLLGAEGHFGKAYEIIKTLPDDKQSPQITAAQWTQQTAKTFHKPYEGDLKWSPEDDDDVKKAQTVGRAALAARLKEVKWGRIIRRVAITTAADGSKAHPHHMRQWWKLQPESLTKILSWLAMGDAPPEANVWIMGARLSFKPKNDTDFRPISISGMLAKVVSKANANLHRESAAKYLTPLGQVAVGVKGGGDIYVAAIRAMFAAAHATNRRLYRLQADLTQGFTRVSRRRIFDALKGDENLHSLIPTFLAQYGQPGAQYSVEHGTVCFVEEGLWQGDGISPLLFCIATTPVIRDELTTLQTEWVAAGNDHPTIMPASQATTAVLSDTDLPPENRHPVSTHNPENTATDLAGFMDDYNYLSFDIQFSLYCLRRFTSPAFAAKYPDISYNQKKFALHASAFVNDDTTTVQTMASLLPTGNAESPTHLAIATTAPPPEGFPFTCQRGLTGLGVPIGETFWEQQQTDKAVQTYVRKMKTILLLDSAMLALIMLRSCALPSVNFLLRTCRYEVSRDSCKVWDVAVMGAAKSILRLGPKDVDITGSDPATRMRTPVRHGGLGLTAAADTCPYARLASIADAHRTDVNMLFGGRIAFGILPILMEWVRGEQQFGMDDVTVLFHDTEQGRGLATTADDDNHEAANVLDYKHIPVHPVDILSTTPKLQNRLRQRLTNSAYATAIQPAPAGDRHAAIARALLISSSQKGAVGLWLTVPSEPRLTLTNNELYVTFRSRFGVQFTFTNIGTSCARCSYEGGSSKDLLRHLEACKGGKNTFWNLIGRHDAVVDVLVRLARLLGFRVRIEPNGEYIMLGNTPSGKRPDFAIADIPFPGDETHYDVQVKNVKCDMVALNPASIPLAAATQSEQAKTKKYEELCKDNGVQFQALTFEAQGAFGTGTLRFLAKLRRLMADTEELVMGDSFSEEQVHAEFTSHVRSLTVAVARGNARHVLAGVAALHSQTLRTGQLQPAVTATIWPVPEITNDNDNTSDVM
jgi:hypothetical protein